MLWSSRKWLCLWHSDGYINRIINKTLAGWIYKLLAYSNWLLWLGWLSSVIAKLRSSRIITLPFVISSISPSSKTKPTPTCHIPNSTPNLALLPSRLEPSIFRIVGNTISICLRGLSTRRRARLRRRKGRRVVRRAVASNRLWRLRNRNKGGSWRWGQRFLRSKSTRNNNKNSKRCWDQRQNDPAKDTISGPFKSPMPKKHRNRQRRKYSKAVSMSDIFSKKAIVCGYMLIWGWWLRMWSLFGVELDEDGAHVVHSVEITAVLGDQFLE